MAAEAKLVADLLREFTALNQNDAIALLRSANGDYAKAKEAAQAAVRLSHVEEALEDAVPEGEDVDVVLVIDGSGSMCPTADVAKTCLKQVAFRLPVSDKCRVGLVQFSSLARREPHQELNAPPAPAPAPAGGAPAPSAAAGGTPAPNLNAAAASPVVRPSFYATKLNTVMERIDAMQWMYESTNFAAALRAAHDVFNREVNPTAKKVIIFVTDGSNEEEKSAVPALRQKLDDDHNVRVVVFGIGTKVNMGELQQLAQDRQPYVIKSFEDFKNLFHVTSAYKRPQITVQQVYHDHAKVEVQCQEGQRAYGYVFEIFDLEASNRGDPTLRVNLYYKEFHKFTVPDPTKTRQVVILKNLPPGATSHMRVSSFTDQAHTGRSKPRHFVVDTILVRLYEAIKADTLNDLLNEMTEKIDTFQLPTQLLEKGVTHLRVAVIGNMGMGKTTTLSTLKSVYSGEYHSVGPTGASLISVTPNMTLVQVGKMHIFDTFGWNGKNYAEHLEPFLRTPDRDKLTDPSLTDMVKKVVKTEDAASILLGNQLSEAQYITEASLGGAPDPVSSKHGVFLVIRALDVQDPERLAMIQFQFQVIQRVSQLPVILIVTHWNDKSMDPEGLLEQNSTNIFDIDVESTLNKIAAATRIPKERMFPILQHMGPELDDDPVKDYLALNIMSSMLDMARSHIINTMQARQSQAAGAQNIEVVQRRAPRPTKKQREALDQELEAKSNEAEEILKRNNTQ